MSDTSDNMADIIDTVDKSYVNYLFSNLNYDQDKPLYIDPANPQRTLSAREIKSMISRTVAGLRHYGLKKGDPVCVMSLNDIYYTPLYLGIIAAGGIFTGINPSYTPHEISHHLSLCKVAFLIASPAALETAKEAAAKSGLPKERIFVFRDKKKDKWGFKSWWRLMCHGEAEWEPVFDPEMEAACYVSSSGTSGLPKAVVVPHKYLENQVKLLVERDLPYEVSRLICIPPFVGYNVPSQHGVPLKTGHTIYVMPRYDVKSFLHAVKEFQITETLLLPPIVLELPNNPLLKADPKALFSLRQIFCGGAAIGSGVQSRMYAILHPDARIAQIYGMTEVGWTCGSLYPEKDETGSVGTPLRTYEIKIVDDNEEEITEPDVTGEIFIKAEYPMLGYLNNETATKAAFAPNVFIRSGDVGKRGANGLYYITDRKKDLIKFQGWQVSPAEIEGVILMHANVLDVAVVGCKLPEPSRDECAHAYIVLKKGVTLTANEVKQWMSGYLAAYKVPREVFFMQSLPRNPTGKLIRRSIETEYLEFTRRKSKRDLAGRLLRERPPPSRRMTTSAALQTPSVAAFRNRNRAETDGIGEVESMLLRQSLEDRPLKPLHDRSSLGEKTVKFDIGGTGSSEDEAGGASFVEDKEDSKVKKHPAP